MPSQLDPNTLAWIRRRAQAQVANQPPTAHQPPTDLAGYQGANVGLNALARAAPAAPPENVGMPRQAADNFNDLPPIIGASEPTYPQPAPMSGRIPGEPPTAGAVTEGPPPLEVRLARARNERALAQGLDRIGTSLAGFAGVSPTTIRAAGTPGLDAQIEELEDTLTDTDRQFMAAYGIELPENMRLSRFNKLFPEARQILNMERLAEKEALDRDVLREKQDFYKTVRNRLPSKVNSEIAELNTTLNSAQRARQAFARAGSQTGPALGRINQILNRAGVADPEFAGLRAELGNLLATYVKSISGAAVTEMEARRLADTLPNTAQRGDTFQTLLDRFITQVSDRRQNILDQYGAQGYNVTSAGPDSSGDGVPSGKIRVRNKATGQTGSISPQFFNPEKYDRL